MIGRKTIDLEAVLGLWEKMKREEDVEWELRPGGMLVQKREDADHNGGIGGGGGDSGSGSGSGSAMISVKVHHGSKQHQLRVPVESAFGTPLTLSFCFSF